MKNTVLLFSFFMIPFLSYSQEIVRFSVQLEDDGIDVPVSISLDEFNINPDKGSLALFEITGNQEKEIDCQVESGYSTNLWFVLNGHSDKKSLREFVLKVEKKDAAPSQNSIITLEKQHKDLVVQFGEQPILKYRFKTTYPPEGVDPLYKRSGFIHPLYSPQGEILSRIQPPDHYHHYGIWGPWTLTHIDGREVDFWNLNKGQGAVRFADFLSGVSGKVFSGFKVLQQHIDFGNKGEDRIALNEILDIRVWNLNPTVWVIDYTSSFNTPLPNGILFDAYRYGGGIGFRATEKWTKDNCTVLTSEGKTRIDADGSRARWCIVEGQTNTKSGRSGILFLSHPSNRMHPEPMRVWPIDANGGRGDLYFEFVPIRYEPWEIKPFRDYTLKYRMIVFDGKMDKQTAEMYWNSFAKMSKIKNKSFTKDSIK